MTVTVAMAESSSGLGSGVDRIDDGGVDTGPVELGVTVKVSCAPALVASAPMFQVTSVALLLASPCVGMAETNVTPSGKLSDTNTLVEGEGP